MYLIRKNWFSARVAKTFNSSALKSILIFFVTHHHTTDGRQRLFMTYYVFPTPPGIESPWRNQRRLLIDSGLQRKQCSQPWRRRLVVRRPVPRNRCFGEGPKESRERMPSQESRRWWRRLLNRPRRKLQVNSDYPERDRAVSTILSLRGVLSRK
jgi:hypothetical protein